MFQTGWFIMINKNIKITPNWSYKKNCRLGEWIRCSLFIDFDCYLLQVLIICLFTWDIPVIDLSTSFIHVQLIPCKVVLCLVYKIFKSDQYCWSYYNKLRYTNSYKHMLLIYFIYYLKLITPLKWIRYVIRSIKSVYINR